MQNVFEENRLNFLKILCSIAFIYLATNKLIKSLFGLQENILIIIFNKLFFFINILQNKNNKLNTIKKTQKQIEEEFPIEIKNKKHILFKIQKKDNINENIIQEINTNSLYNFTPLVNKFSIFTYNILCQKFMMRRERKDLSLEYRMEKIKEKITNLDPDIICLQETVFHTIKLHLENFLSAKYEVVYMENYGSNFYNMTAFKKDKFEIKESKKINLDDIKVEGNRGIYCLELKIKNNKICSFNNSLNNANSNNINSFNNCANKNSHYDKNIQNINNTLLQGQIEGKKESLNKFQNKENINLDLNCQESKDSKDLQKEKQNNNINPKEENQIPNQDNNNNNNQHQNMNIGKAYSKHNKNKEKNNQNFFYNYRNFIEYNKAENKNKLVVYNVHFPWKPIFDFEKCLILNKIADDVMNKNQRNYIIIGDFNSKPNSLLMRMLYLENFINEIKYFKNIINFKSEYFRKRNSNEDNFNINKNQSNQNFGFYDFEENSDKKNSKIKKYSYINTDNLENFIEKSNKKVNEKVDPNVNNLISDFDILKEIKDLKNNNNENSQKNSQDILNSHIKNKSNTEENKGEKNYTNKIEESKNNGNNDNFWTKLSEQKHLENESNKKIKEFDILKELFYLNIRIEKEKHNYSLDSKDRIILKEILKLLTLSDNKKTFQDVFSTENLEMNNTKNQINFNYYNNNNVIDFNDNVYNNFQNSNNFNSNYINYNNQICHNYSNNYNYEYQINNLHLNSFSYNQNQVLNSNLENNKVNSFSLGISISNENYSKIRNMFDNFKNLYIKYKFKSAYENYQIEYKKNNEILNILKSNENLENISITNLIDAVFKNSEKNSVLTNKMMIINKDNINNENNEPKMESEENKKIQNPSHISDYFNNHPLYTNFTDNFKDTIDYIFYSKYLVVDKILKLPDYEELALEGFLPSSRHPSDHLPLYAEFSTN